MTIGFHRNDLKVFPEPEEEHTPVSSQSLLISTNFVLTLQSHPPKKVRRPILSLDARRGKEKHRSGTFWLSSLSPCHLENRHPMSVLGSLNVPTGALRSTSLIAFMFNR